MDSQTQTLIKCPMGCGRSFIEESLRKHVIICQDVFQQKRFAFNSQMKRIGQQIQTPKKHSLKTEPTQTIKHKQLKPQQICNKCKQYFDFIDLKQHQCEK